MRRIILMIVIIVGILLIVGCSEDERVNPEATLNDYVNAWDSFQFEEMANVLSDASMDVLDKQDWLLQERMTKIYEDLGVDQIEITYESRDFEEEEIDLDEIEELTYPIKVNMATIAGDLQYNTDVVLTKTILIDENDDEVEQWEVAWHPSHIFLGLEDPSDQVAVDTEPPNRGEIYDRNGEGLAINGSILRIGFQPDLIDDFDISTAAVAEILDLDVDAVREIANQHPDNPDWFTEVIRLPVGDPRSEELISSEDVSGVWVYTRDGREYPLGEEMGHLIGHIGSITAEELEDRQGEGYHVNSILGKRGLEYELEDRLRGKNGVTISTKDKDNNMKHVILETEPEHGEDIVLTIDANYQRFLSQSLGSESGAGVVMHPTTGEVLALVSQPSFNSNHRYLGLKERLADEVEDNLLLYERRFENSYSPGSIFKPFTAAVGIEEGTLDPDEVIKIDDRQWQPDSSWGNNRVTRVNSNTDVDLEIAMIYSDNIYFAQQALRIGSDSMEKWAENFGFGEAFPFSIPLRSSTIANEGLSSDILLADTGYGQGQVQITPVHMTALYSMFVNGGSIVQPVLFAEETTGELWKEGVVSPETTSTVLETIISAVENSNGTAYRADPGHTRAIAGKTGTAELKGSLDEEDGKQLGWFVGLDYEREDILITVMLQNVEGRGGSGLAVDKVNEFLGKIE